MKPSLSAMRRRLKRLYQFFAQSLNAFFSRVRRVGRGATQAIGRWWRKRKGVYLLQGLPAAAVFLAGVLFLAVAALNSEEQKTSWLNQQVSQARQSKNLPAVRIALERLARQGPDNPEPRFDLAMVAQEEGNGRRALTLAKALAPINGPGYAPAHVWLAHMMLGTTPSDPTLRQQAEVHLLKALQIQSDNVPAHLILGKLYAQSDRLDLAEIHLTAVLPTHPELALDLAGVEKRLGKTAVSQSHAAAARAYFRKRVDAALEDHAARLDLAKTHIFLEEFPTAVAVLQQGLSLTKHDLYRVWLGAAYASWVKSLPERTDGERGKRLVLIEQGLGESPKSPELLMLLGESTQIAGPSADKSRELLQSLLADGKASATLHLVLGIDAYRQSKPDAARAHFEQARRLDPNMPVIANNFAWILANGATPDLPRALEVIDAVVAQAPKDPHFRDTRGQILVKLGRWQDGVTDLEAALPDLPDDRSLHEALADAYSHLGLDGLARQHRQRAAQAEQKK